ncbi:MAG: hypothetical protein M3R53_06460 [Candidatus Eremiobacteraeota bacterium]|nr:hypothetical protein [Candidatus Eremiobacteraeota bacterium]
MPRFSALALTLGCASAIAVAALIARADEPAALTVPVAVRIPVALTTTLTSQTARVGDTFAFKTTKSENLGGLVVPSGTAGHGRIALASPAHDKAQGSLALQADSIDLPDGRTVSVNVDVARPPRGHLANKHTRFFVVPLPTIGIFPALIQSQSGNLVLDAGTGFGVVTVAPRSVPAPLYTVAPRMSPSATAGPTPPATEPSAAATTR